MNPRTILCVFSGMLVMILAGALFCPLPLYGQASDTKTPVPQKVAPPPSPAAIPVPEIATQATQVSNLLRTTLLKLAPSSEIEKIQHLLPRISERIDLRLADMAQFLEEQPTLEALQAQQQAWQQIELETSGWLKVLTERAVALRTAQNQLSDLKQTWAKTLDAAQASKAPGPVLQQAGQVLADINAAQAPLETQRASVLDLQSWVAKELSRCNTALSQIAEAQQLAVGGILRRDGLPIWKPALWARAQARLPIATRKVAADSYREISDYVSGSSGVPFRHFLILAGLLLLFCGMRSHLHRWKTSDEEGSSAIAGLDHPYAASFLVFFLLVSGPLSEAAPAVKALCGIMAVAPMIRLTRPVIDPRVVPELFVLWVLFAIDVIRQAFAGALLIDQIILVFETMAGMAVFGWSLLLGHLRGIAVRATGSAQTRTLRVIAGVAFLILGAAMVAGVAGYLRLCRILASEVLAGGVTALALYASLRVASGVVAFFFRVWPLRLLHMVARHRDLLERRVHKLFIWIAVVTWAARSLDYVGLLQPTLSLGSAILETKLERGSISVSIGDIIAFFLTVWISYLFSSFLRFVLREDVYPRIGIQRGASYASSSLLNYIILALGFVVALGVLGVDLTKVTVLAGAFGVGIGFGLQSVVNNFVSGLILLFERPVHVGDIVEIDDLLGEIRRIGIRSSVVRTWQGADIIVPNADLVSKQVTNWTLGDSLRRIDLDVGVNYSARPDDVIHVLESVAGKHPDILQNPRPRGLFVAYGDSTINFQLRAWTDKFMEWPRIKSDLAVALYDAAHAAGMSFPFPQREVRVLHDSAKKTGPPPVDSGTTVSSEETQEKK
ncbi:MAG TPA: mechanosensitive ion channel domain-containing protein [Syntrophorhabdales bacterium]|nr:mechanosensitive ion channel domain-containing protein [Syntrophorhabdales bacterium]